MIPPSLLFQLTTWTGERDRNFIVSLALSSLLFLSYTLHSFIPMVYVPSSEETTVSLLAIFPK